MLVPGFSPDGRTLLYYDRYDGAALCETATGTFRTWLDGRRELGWTIPTWVNPPFAAAPWCVSVWPHGDQPAVLRAGFFRWRPAISPDGQRLAIPSLDGTVLVWDMRRLLPKPAPAKPLATGEALRCWRALCERSDMAHLAIERLAQNPRETIALLSTRLHPPRPTDEKHLARLVADLDSDDFAPRQKAEDELRRLGPGALDALLRGLESNPSLHARRTIERLLREAELSDRYIVLVRALEVLERCRTPDARLLLVKLAREKSAPWFRREVQAVLKRWGQEEATRSTYSKGVRRCDRLLLCVARLCCWS
jgi:hypothetical protein